MKQDANTRLSRVASAVTVLLILLGIVCPFVALAYMKSPQGRARQNPSTPLTGTWVGENGNVINIRPDGTARTRSSASDREFGYFEWTCDSGNFAIYLYKEKHNLGWFVRRVMLDDTPTDQYDVIEVTPTEITLRSDGGTDLTFKSTRDIELESAP